MKDYARLVARYRDPPGVVADHVQTRDVRKNEWRLDVG
jgi:hypothetical protein